ncbi:argininosuccinate synthase-related protein [Streptantibioticus ferralitis]|uniref:argininosuccinate synthase n=1 Tax=Streptantibioticus ferralitis TaxID=236510 RepID=A0ABT5YVT7_9ACTN|nr:argininosuccinate synthase-related protein [Streptantibioticus ferralitis]MDF2255512.1 argininosuccinate synthase-related protein [Streptantibioticus ferralitis]
MHNSVIRSFRELATGGTDIAAPLVTMFSGGLDSTYLLYRLRDMGATDIHALTVDLGEGESQEAKQEICDRLGVKLHVLEGTRQFVDEFVRPAISAQAVYLGTHPISSSLSRPLIARLAVDLAQELGSETILHTANRSQNTLRRLNGALELIGFTGRYGSPYDLEPVDRPRKSAELTAAGLTLMSGRTVSSDSNLWCREFESGSLDDPEGFEVPERLYQWTRASGTPAEETVDVGFLGGVPTSVDGRPMALPEMIGTLNSRVGRHGLGRYSGLEHLGSDVKVLEAREMPAAWLLLRSYRQLESAVLRFETIREKTHLEQLWVREAVEGRWYGELRRSAQAFIDTCAVKVTGSVRWRLGTGRAGVESITARDPLYLRDRETWERASVARERSTFAAAVGSA